MVYTLKPTTEADYEFVYQLNKVTMKELVERIYGSWDENLQRQYFKDNFSLINNFIIVENESYIGNFAFEETKERLFIKNIQLLPQFQGKGIGSQILQELIKSATLKKIPLELRVYKLNGKAKKLYEKLGFIISEETSTHFLMRYPTGQQYY